MNIFNRTFLGLYSLIWFGACVGLIALAWNTGQQLDIGVGGFELRAFIVSEEADRWIFSVLMALLGMVGLVTFFTAFRSSGITGAKTIRTRREDGTFVDIGSEVAEGMLRQEIEQLPHVRQANPVIRSNGGIVESQIAVSIDPGARIADVSAAVTETTGAVLRHRIGAMQVRRPAIHLTYEEVSARPSGRPRPPEPAPEPAAGEMPPPPPPPPPTGYSASGEAVPSPPRDGVLPPPPRQEASSQPLLWESAGPPPPPPDGPGQDEWRPEEDEDDGEDRQLPPPPPSTREGDDTSIVGEDHRA